MYNFSYILNRSSKVELKTWDVKHVYSFIYSLDCPSIQIICNFFLQVCVVEKWCMAVSQMWFIFLQMSCLSLPRDCKADLLPANIVLNILVLYLD